MPVAAECYGEFSCDLIKKRGNQKSTFKNIVKFPQFVMFCAGCRSHYKCPNTAVPLTGSSIWSVYFIPSVKGTKVLTRLKRITRVLKECCHVKGMTAVTRSLMFIFPSRGRLCSSS